ncbi:MAG: hypothetical protein AB1393_14445 [Candidatus Edwardsbacteria bacterium]
MKYRFDVSLYGKTLFKIDVHAETKEDAQAYIRNLLYEDASPVLVDSLESRDRKVITAETESHYVLDFRNKKQTKTRRINESLQHENQL